MREDKFISPTKGELSFKELVGEIIDYILADVGQEYRIIVGTDSSGRAEVDFVVAIVIYRVGKGGRYFWKRIYKENLYSLAQVIYEEVSISLQTAQNLLEEIQLYVKHNNIAVCNLRFEIHVDVGERGDSRSIIKEVVGMVLSSGFEVKTKPEAFGATCVADRKC